jgi:NAD(P)-dependent dehydrogenase (short-subunit alcohol dehydrogenase family)
LGGDLQMMEGTNMPAILEGKIALVTGVSHDGQVGQAVAKVLAENGTALAICARTQSNVEKRAEELRQAGARVLALAASLTDELQVRQSIERVLSEYKRIDILVNLAGGLTRYKPAVEHSLDDWNHELNNNLLSAFLASRGVFPHMREAGGGAIINFARAGLSQANMLAYNCAKAGIEALTRTLALEGRDFGIRVNAVAPGLVDTASNVAAMKPKDLKRWTKRSDIAETVVFLASEAAAGITGQVIAVTGWGL